MVLRLLDEDVERAQVIVNLRNIEYAAWTLCRLGVDGVLPQSTGAG
jgi:hypothetical protein